MPGNGDRSGGAEARATEGARSAAVGLPNGVNLVSDNSGGRVYEFSAGGNRVTFKVFNDDARSGSVSFTVGGGYDRGGLQGRDADRAALTVMRIFKHDVGTRSNGFKYDTIAYTGDGFGAKRAAAYERAGFSAPYGGRPGGTQFGVVKNGKLVPDKKAMREHGTDFASLLADL